MSVTYIQNRVKELTKEVSTYETLNKHHYSKAKEYLYKLEQSKSLLKELQELLKETTAGSNEEVVDIEVKNIPF